MGHNVSKVEQNLKHQNKVSRSIKKQNEDVEHTPDVKIKVAAGKKSQNLVRVIPSYFIPKFRPEYYFQDPVLFCRVSAVPH